VTTQDGLLEIEGKAEKGKIVMTGRNQKGELVRGTWEPLNGKVHEFAVKSSDGGKRWEPWFDLSFQAHGATDEARPGNRDEDPKQTVAALDSEYQDAVKHNDAQTMDRILADDFVLVTSSGKTYNKSDLIQEAKSGRITYEHQEDTDKTVRVWGDIAVVTAYLWEKGMDDGKAFEYRLWFSDVYRRTPTGWRYVFAQSAYRAN
jgi:ketosteroid isomerase-like protein